MAPFPGTPMIGLTPFHPSDPSAMKNGGGATTPYHSALTPNGYGGQFSPHIDAMNGVMSPGYQSPSPAYYGAAMQSPGNGQSPMYGV